MCLLCCGSVDSLFQTSFKTVTEVVDATEICSESSERVLPKQTGQRRLLRQITHPKIHSWFFFLLSVCLFEPCVSVLLHTVIQLWASTATKCWYCDITAFLLNYERSILRTEHRTAVQWWTDACSDYNCVYIVPKLFISWDFCCDYSGLVFYRFITCAYASSCQVDKHVLNRCAHRKSWRTVSWTQFRVTTREKRNKTVVTSYHSW